VKTTNLENSPITGRHGFGGTNSTLEWIANKIVKFLKLSTKKAKFMKQLNVPDEMKVDIDFTDNHVPDSVKTFQPVLFKDGNAYCCVLGPDPQQGVFGCGETPLAALKDWDKNFQQRKEVNDKDDEVSLYIHRVMNPDENGI
jgi:hypothetical protein